MAMDAETVDLAIKGTVGLIVVTGFTRFLKKLDSLEATLKGVTETLNRLSANEGRWEKYFKRYDRLIEMLRKRDHKFFNILQSMRMQGELKNGWHFNDEEWDLPGAYDDKTSDDTDPI